MNFINFDKLFSNYLIIYGIYGICGIFLTWLTNYFLHKYIIIANKYKIIDLPNNRSSHKLPTPRGGGVVVAIISQLTIILLYLLELLSGNIFLALSCSFILAILGFIDDLINLSIKIRLFFQFIISFIALLSILFIFFSPCGSQFLGLGLRFLRAESLGLGLGALGILKLLGLLFLLVWSINLFNFMDGTDGLAGVEAIFVLCLGGILIYLITNNIHFSSYLFLISFIILGFLKFNWPPAKIFMGDAGSYFLGFLIGISALISHYIYGVSLFYWLLLYSVFLSDSTFTLIKRIMHTKQWYKPHREHAYQQMQILGWQHKKILYSVIIINSILGVITFFAFYKKFLCLISIGTYFLLGMLYLYIEFRSKSKKYEKSF